MMKIGDLVHIKYTHSPWVGSVLCRGDSGIIIQSNVGADEGHRWTVLVAGNIYAFSSSELSVEGISESR